jgi:hypothetical protein
MMIDSAHSAARFLDRDKRAILHRLPLSFIE